MSNFTLPNGDDYFVDSEGRLLIFSCGIDGRILQDPRDISKTTGKVFPSSNSCIDDARWQYIRNNLAPTSDNWRLAIATTDATQSKKPDAESGNRGRLIGTVPRNINKMRNANVRALPSSMTDWVFNSDIGGVIWCWDEDSGSNATGLDYSGFLWKSSGSQKGFAIYAYSSRNIYTSGTFSYFHQNLEMWVLPPGVPNFDVHMSNKYDAPDLSHNPADPASNANYGWFTRTANPDTNPLSGSKPFQGVRQLVLKWDGEVILDTYVEGTRIVVAPASGLASEFDSWGGAQVPVVGNSTYTYASNKTKTGVIVGNYVYYAGNNMGDAYGWPNSGTGYQEVVPYADYNNGFEITRRRYFPSIAYHTGDKTNGQTSATPDNAVNIFFDIQGGAGGYGGTGSWNYTTAEFPATPRGYGQRLIGYIEPRGYELSFKHRIGGNGTNGVGQNNGVAGTGGVSSGGRGGDGHNSGDGFVGGGGGGGGASSGLQFNASGDLTNNWYLAVAGGAGGAGGNQYFDFGSTRFKEPTPQHVIDYASNSQFINQNGQNGFNYTGTAFNGGGGGGGGGTKASSGSPGGGDGGAASGAGNSIVGKAGEGGSGVINNRNDAVEFGWIVPDWDPNGTTQSGTAAPYWPIEVANNPTGWEYGQEDEFIAKFGSHTRNSNWGSTGRVDVYYYTLNALTVAADIGTLIKVRQGGEWIPVKKVFVKDSGVWEEVTEVFVKEGGAWRSMLG